MSSSPKKPIPLYLPEVTEEDIESVTRSLRDGWVAPVGPYLRQFEEEFSRVVGGGYAVALSSGTAALHLSLLVAGVQPGDEVFCSTFTFIATANPILYLGARPVFVDSEERTWNLDVDLLREYLQQCRRTGKKWPRFLILAHIYGQPAEMQPILQICEEYDIVLIEDAAEALGASYQGRPMGRFGQIAAFSFNGNKIVTTAGGGMIVTDSEEWANRVRYLSTQAKDNQTHYYHSEMGFNYRLPSMGAALGISQLRRLEHNVTRKRALFDRYVQMFADLPAVVPMPTIEGAYESRWMSSFYFDPQHYRKGIDSLLALLASEGIEARKLWYPLHRQPVYTGADAILNGVAEKLYEGGLSIASSAHLSESDQQRVVEVIRRGLQGQGE